MFLVAAAATADRDLEAWLAHMRVSREDLRASDNRTEDLPWTRSETRRRHGILRSASRRLPVTVLPDDIVRQIQSMCEFRKGVHRVGFKLADTTLGRWLRIPLLTRFEVDLGGRA